jgi:hypothetical protein
MKRSAAAAVVLGIALGGCAPYPVYQEQAAAPRPVNLDPWRRDECNLIRREIAQQQSAAQLSGVTSTLLVQAAVQLNASNVIAGLETRAAIAGCG